MHEYHELLHQITNNGLYPWSTMKLDTRLLESADENGYQIDHQAVDQRNEYALNAAAGYPERNYLVSITQDQSEKLMGGYECCHDGRDEGSESYVPDPCGGLPCCDEYAD